MPAKRVGGESNAGALLEGAVWQQGGIPEDGQIAVKGLSSPDFLDASENATRAEQAFQNGVWYAVRIEVRPEDIRVWINDRPVVNASIKGKKVSLRAGDIDHCLPFGFATWGTKAKVRRVFVAGL